MKLCAAILMLLSAGSCSSPVVEFADWTIPVPDGTPIIGHVGVPLEDRSETFELIEDLVIDASDGDPEKAFYNPATVSIDADSGRIYVYDSGNHRIQVFERDGTFVSSIGREGSGPGELSGWGSAAITAGRLVHVGDGRLSVWGLGGDLVHATNSELAWLIDTQPALRARFLGVNFEDPEDWPESPASMVFSSINLEGQVEHRYVALPAPEPPFFRPHGSYVNSGSMPRISWRAADGDYIYALDPDDTEEIALTRYRIAEPLAGH